MSDKNCSCKKIFSQKENRSSYQLHNVGSHYICEVRVDGGMITSGKKCDWLYKVYKVCDRRLNNAFTHCSNDNICQSLKEDDKDAQALQQIILIELKGEDVDHAVEQIAETYKFLKANYPDLIRVDRKAYIVSTRSPSRSSDFDKIRRDFRTKTGLILDRVKPQSPIDILC